MNNHSILVVNDAAEQLELLAFILGEADYRVLRAENGVEGMDIARRESLDLIISDVIMPEMDGVEFCRQTRADKQLRSIPFLLVSALRKDTESVIEGLASGADDYIEAPYEPIRLVAKAAQLIERKRSDDALRESEERYRNFIEQSTEGIWRIEFKVPISTNIPIDQIIELAVQHSYYAECNDAMAQMYGFATANDLTGKYCKELINFSESDNREFLTAFIENGYQLSDAESHEFNAYGGDKYFLNNFVGIVESGKLVSVWGIQRDITESKLAEQVLRASQRRLEKQNAVLNELTKRRRLFHIPVQDAIREITEITAVALETARVSVWLYGDDKSKIKALNLYDTNQNSHSNDAELWQSDYPNYFAALVNDEVIVCNEAQTDAITHEFTEDYFKPLGITSMLDVPIRIDGQVIGVVCHEHVGEARKWKLDEQNFATSMAGLIALLLEASERRQAENALRASREHLEIAQQAAKIGSFEFDFNTRFITCSASLEILYGVPPGSFTGKVENWSKHIHPEDLPGIRQQLKEISLGVPVDEYKSEFRVVLDDGSICWIVSKGRIFYNDAKPARMVGVNIDITEQKKTEEFLRQAEARYRNLIELSPAIVYLAQPFPPYSTIYVSPNIQIFGYSVEEWHSRNDMWKSLIHEEDRERVLSATENAMNHSLDNENEYRVVARNGNVFWVHDKGRFISDKQGNKIGWQGVILDVTETKKLEEQLRQSQKLESIGKLAGGIAHDFNNMLTAINGYSDLTLRRLKDDDPLRSNIEEIKKAGERSAALTHQLLAFSRKQVLKPKVLNLNEVIIDISKMLNRLIGEHIHLELVTESNLGMVEADSGQLTQVIINLAVNARDAMPHGGNLIIETANVYLDEEYAENHFPTKIGSYVLVAITDTGTGIDEDTKKHIFEPFYTTKNVGHGTGLGLATVYGIIKQSEGYIWVDSEIGKGTSFKIYLPRIDEIGAATKEIKLAEPTTTAMETILLVEDEDVVRNMSRQMLEAYGYQVFEARNGVEALSVCESHFGAIDLLLTDVVMPQMSGRRLAEKIAETQPQIRLLYMSAYTEDAVIRQDMITEDKNFIQKPFTFESLASKLRELLD